MMNFEQEGLAVNLLDTRGSPGPCEEPTTRWQRRVPPLEGEKMTQWWQPLAGVILGWTLGQLSEWWRQRYRARRRRVAIYVELRDVQSTVKTRILVLKELLRKFITERVLEDYPADIPYIIFKADFAEIALQFSESERLALMHIYGLVDALNANFLIIRSNWDTMSGDEMLNNENLRKAIQISQGACTNARVAEVMIALLLRERHKFDIRDTKNTEVLTRTLAEAKEELKDLNKLAPLPDNPTRSAGCAT